MYIITVPKIIGLFLIPAYIIAISILVYLQISTIFESSQLLLIFNTVFIGLIPIAISYLAARVYVMSATVSFMWMGCGMLTFGLSSILAASLISLPDGPNILVTIHNSGVLGGSICQTIGGLLLVASGTSWTVRSKGNAYVIAVYSGIIILTLLFSLATVLGYLPRFFTQGTGPMLIRQFVLTSAMNLYIVSAALFMIHYKKLRSDFLYWYGLSLAMISIGLLGIVLQKSVGCPIGWLGRSAQYLGGLFGLIAILKAASGAISQKLSIEESIALLFWDVEASYKNLVEMANDGIITFGQTGSIVAWNPAAQRMFDRSKNETIGSSFFDLIIPDKYTDILKTQIESLMKPSSKVTMTKLMEIEARRKGGSIFPVELSLSLRETPMGWLCTCIVRDVSERKRAEEELRRSEARFRGYFESPLIGIAITSLDKGWLEVNSSLCAMLGYSRQELTGMTWAQLTHPDDLDADVAQFQRVLVGEIDTYAMEKRFIPKNGDVLWTTLSVSCVRKPDGSVDYMVDLLQDITMRKRAEKATWRLASIVESSDDAIIGKTLDGTITSWNKGAENLYGYSAEEIIGQPISDLLPPEVSNNLPDILTSISRGDVVRHFETKRRTKDGRIVDVSLTISPIKTQEGQIIGASSTARDITERKLLEQENQKLIDELKKALSEVKKLSGFLPICSSCKKIRDDKGYWKEVERYIGEHSEAQFSHGICPDCMRKLYPEYADEVLASLENDEKK